MVDTRRLTHKPGFATFYILKSNFLSFQSAPKGIDNIMKFFSIQFSELLSQQQTRRNLKALFKYVVFLVAVVLIQYNLNRRLSFGKAS